MVGPWVGHGWSWTCTPNGAWFQLDHSDLRDLESRLRVQLERRGPATELCSHTHSVSVAWPCSSACMGKHRIPPGLIWTCPPLCRHPPAHRHQRTCGVSLPDPPPQVDELDVLGDGLDELLTVADTHAELGQDDAQVGRALGQPQGGDEHRALGDVLAHEALAILGQSQRVE